MPLRLVLFVILWVLSGLAMPARAAQTDPARICDLAAARAAKATDVPIDLLLAITRVETGRSTGGEAQPWPWTINADGQGAWFPSKEEAVAAATEHETDGTGTFDVGCFQLNIRWHGKGFATLDDMFDPDLNALYAAKFLSGLYAETGDWTSAVSAYHSRTPELAEVYVDKVRQVLNADTPIAIPTEAEMRAPRENLFPLLQAGAQGSAGSLVPLSVARGRLIGG